MGTRDAVKRAGRQPTRTRASSTFRSSHDALDALCVGIMSKKVNWIAAFGGSTKGGDDCLPPQLGVLNLQERAPGFSGAVALALVLYCPTAAEGQGTLGA
jgi:hypothetical protein